MLIYHKINNNLVYEPYDNIQNSIEKEKAFEKSRQVVAKQTLIMSPNKEK